LNRATCIVSTAASAVVVARIQCTPNVIASQLRRGPACERRSGAPAAVIRAAEWRRESMSAGVPPAPYGWTEEL
jgi:hypothetical protein